jgi:hypothetical protein
MVRFWGKGKADALLDEAEAHPDDDMDQTLAIEAERSQAERERYE